MSPFVYVVLGAVHRASAAGTASATGLECTAHRGGAREVDAEAVRDPSPGMDTGSLDSPLCIVYVMAPES